MYLCKFGQKPSSGPEDNPGKRSYGDTDADGIRTKNNMLGGHNQDQDKHSGGPTLGPNCYNGNKQTAKVLPEVKDFNLPYHPQRKQILDCLEWIML